MLPYHRLDGLGELAGAGHADWGPHYEGRQRRYVRDDAHGSDGGPHPAPPLFRSGDRPGSAIGGLDLGREAVESATVGS